MSLKSTLFALSILAAGFIAYRLNRTSIDESLLVVNHSDRDIKSKVNQRLTPDQAFESLLLFPSEDTSPDTITTGPFTENDPVEQGTCNLLAPWVNAGNTTGMDDSRATATRATGLGAVTSNCLDLQIYNFNVPTDATILGITVTVERSGNVRTSGNNVTDNEILLLRDVAGAVGSNKALAVTWSTTDSIVTYGGANDLWGYAWTAAEVNSPFFGLRLRANRNRASGSVIAQVDHVTMSVTYSLPHKAGMTASNVISGCPSSDGTANWAGATPANLGSDNGANILGFGLTGYATVSTNTGDAEDTTDCLDLSGFGFCLCPNAIIDSITVEIDRGKAAAGDQVFDTKVALLYSGGTESNNKANTSLDWTQADSRASYGGDNWGIPAITAAMVNDPGFGVRIQARLLDNVPGILPLANARIDEVLVRVYCSFNGKAYVDSAATGANNGRSWADAYTDLQDALDDCFVDTICVAKGTYYPAPPPPPTYNVYNDCGSGMDAIITAGNGSISVQFLTNNIEYVKIWDQFYAPVMQIPNMDGFLCDSFVSMMPCGIGPTFSVNLPAGIYRVVINYLPTNDGSQDCYVNSANGNDVIIPAIGPADRTISFNIPDSVVLLGGFDPANGDTLLSDRDWVCNKTILCGDISVPDDISDNSYHVVTTTNVTSTTVDGFCISGGNADGMFDFRYGGGWFNQGLDSDSSNPTIVNCIITGNNAIRTGGGMANYGNQGPTHPTLINCILSNNTAAEGAGMYNYGAHFSSSPLIINSILSGNSATGFGGAMYNDGSDGISSPTLINSVISGNQVPSTFNGNGGAMLNDESDGGVSIPTLINSIIWNNTTNTDPGNQTVFRTFGSSTPQISYSIIQTPNGFTSNGGNKPDGTDPLFVFAPTDGAAPTAAGNFHVNKFSTAVDMGNGAANSYPTDLDGNQRIINTIDIGAYELQNPDCDKYVGITTIYVDSSATGGNNGFDWDSAFTDLQDALLAAKTCGIDTILVAQGTYYPSDTLYVLDPCTSAVILTINPDRNVSFDIPDSVVILGGFPSGGDTARDWVCNKTILCGDIQKDGDLTNNSYHVVTTNGVGTTTLVDGFYISGGYADNQGGNGYVKYGAGWFNHGVNGLESSPTIKNCVFTGNETGIADGGNFGGGAFASWADGGSTNPTLIDCILNNNRSLKGGAIRTYSEGSFTCNLTIINSIISGNVATSDMINNSERGGGIQNTGINTTLQLINSVLSGNHCTAPNQGGALYNANFGSAKPTAIITNCIIWNNGDPSGNFTYFYLNPGAGDSVKVSYSIIGPQTAEFPGGGVNGTGSFKNVTGNKLGVDPLFLDAPVGSATPTAQGNFHVLSGSPAIDMGLNSANPQTTDLDGHDRVYNNIIDIGAYESQFLNCDSFLTSVIYVDSAAIGANNGSSWDNAYTDLQDALLVARLCKTIDTIKVARGTYYPSGFDTVVVFDRCTNEPDSFPRAPDRTVSFNIRDSLVVLGGYDSAGVRDWICNKTILCGEIQQDGDPSNNSYHVVTTFNVDSLTIVDGFCISDGNANVDVDDQDKGGGWYNEASIGGNSDPTIKNCVFQLNLASEDGGGMVNISLDDTSAVNPTYINCIFRGNSAGENGGAISNDASAGGAINIEYFNCLFSGNAAVNNGGALANNGSALPCSARLINCVINGNRADDGGAIYINGTFPQILINSIVWVNSSTFNDNSQVNVSYSIIQDPGYNDDGNNKPDGTNPQFIDPPYYSQAPTIEGNFHVLSSSPAIDMGFNDVNPIPTDLDDRDRIYNKIIDIGVYETTFFNCDSFTASVVYVDSSATGDNDGTSWDNAFTDLQDALMVARLCKNVDTVKVAKGTYYPSKADTVIVFDKCTNEPDTFPFYDDQTVSFNIPDSVVVLGGYDSVGNRDWICNKTILCGDIDGDGMLAGNSYHVVSTFNVSDATEVDGFCISGGNANGGEDFAYGGGWFNQAAAPDSSNPVIRNCIITLNHADRNGGGMANYGAYQNEGNTNPTLINCIISFNTADRGAGMYNYGFNANSSPSLTNTIFNSNQASTYGGAMYNDGEEGMSSPLLVNCVIYGNTAGNDGGAFFNSGDDGFGGTSEPVLINSIVWNNSTDAFYNAGTGITHVSYSMIQSGNTYTSEGNNKPDGTDPLFVNAPAGDFHVQSTSLAIDMGLNSANSYPTDLEGNVRIQNSTIDLGVYEFTGIDCSVFTSNIVYVDSSATGLNNGSNWANAFTNLQDALLAARFCIDIDTVKVALGTYFPADSGYIYDRCTGALVSVTPPDRDESFDIPDSTVVLGGYGHGADSLIRDPHCNKTILSGEIQHDGLDTNNTYHVVTTHNVSDQTIVDGFCITKGYAVYIGNDPFPTYRNAGGGWLNNGIGMSMPVCVSNPQILNCTFTDNHALLGAGLCNLGIFGTASPYIYQSNFYSDSSILGGGIANIGYDGESSPLIVGVKVQGNTGIAAGGILNIAGSVLGLGNFAPLKGGLRSSSTMPASLKEAFEKSGLTALINSMSHQMSSLPEGPQGLPAQIPGFGVSSPHIKNSLITGNSAFAGGGIVNYVLNFSTIGLAGGESSPQIINTTIAGNSALVGGGMINSDEGFVNDETGKVNPCIVNSIFWNNVGFISDPDMYNNFNGSGEYADTVKFHHNISESDYATLTNNVASPHIFDTTLSGNKYQVDPLFIDGRPGTEAATTAGNYHLQGTSPAIDMGDSTACDLAFDLDLKPRVVWSTIDIGPYEFLLNCDSLTIYVTQDGNVPVVPLDSLIGATLGPECSFFVNGVLNTSGIQFNCTDTGVNDIDLLVTRPGCAGPDTLAFCTKVITLLDTFSKHLTAIDQLNVSLDATCMRVLTPQDVLVNFGGCNNNYVVHIVYPHGTNHYDPDNKLDISHVGYCMVYSVTEVNTGNKTWGRICVEDKFPPQIVCTDDTISCFELADYPLVVGDTSNCSNDQVKLIGEQWVDYGCDSAYLGYVVRTIWGSDQWGNSRTCESRLYIEKTPLDSVSCPTTPIDLPCLITHQVGGYIHPRELKTPIIVDKDKVTPAFLLSLQKATFEFKDGGSKDAVLNPSFAIVPNYKGHSIYQQTGALCKVNALYRDQVYSICGNGVKIRREWLLTDWCTFDEDTCVQWIIINDKQAPIVRDTILPVVYSSPHDCGQFVDLPLLSALDCNTTTQTYILKYYEEGTLRTLNGKLPATHIWLPTGFDSVEVSVSDVCNNFATGKIYIEIIDITPPTPVCDEYTQITVDPTTCWSAVAAKDLDNGSRDNCCNVLHFAAAKMDSIIFWRDYWSKKLETEVGKTAFWNEKTRYDALIEDWINCYVFSDTVHFDECGTKQVVLRVYEACGIPRYDPHVFPCSPHAWFCYNTYLYIGDFNFNWFDPKGAHSCGYRPELTSFANLDLKYASYDAKHYYEPKFIGSAQYFYCNVPFYFGALKNTSHVNNNPPGKYCSERLYSDCMVNVLVDDKQAPVVNHLDDVTVYCDNVPYRNPTLRSVSSTAYPDCGPTGEHYMSWPGELKYKNIVHGYYGGSDYLGIHPGASSDHNDPQACSENIGWSPIYCQSWLYLDSFDLAGHINPLNYFEKPVLVDKKRPLDHVLKDNEFTFTDNCALNDATLKYVDNGTINGCSEGWIQRTWTIEDKCGNKVTATQKVVVKHRSDFEVLFPRDTTVTCDFLNRTDTSARGAGSPKISDDECEQVGLTYKDEIFNVVDGACYKIVRTWTLIDWCIYDPNQHERNADVIVDDRYRANSTNRSCVYRYLKDNNDGYMKYVQIIKVIDEIRPELTCIDQTVCIDQNCSTIINIPLTATDNCSSEIRFRVDITKPDGSHDKRADITSITGSNFTAGLYSIQVIAKDQCGNEDTCSMKLTIVDCKKPTPYCLNGITTVVMPGTGSIQIWAKDFDKGSFDNCTTADKLKFSFSKDTLDASKTLTCANILNGKEQSVQVEVWVTDQAGRQDFCTTYLLLQDNGGQAGGVCNDSVASGSNLAKITGTLVTEEKEAVESGIVELKGSSMTSSPTWKSDINGTYQFGSLPMNGTYTIKAIRDDQPMNGVSTLDLVLIQKHILGTESLKSPYKIIAADVNNDHDVSAVDLIELRKLILGLYDKLPENTSWRFVPKSYSFSDINNPWSYPSLETIDNMNPQTVSIVKDFIGVKIGDVNATAIPHSLMGTEVRSNETGLIFEVEDQLFKAGDKVTVQFKSPNFKGITGFQGTMRITNEELRFTNVSSLLGSGSSLGMKANNFGTRWEHEGLITMSWNTNTSLDLKEDEVLFTMNFIAKSAGRLSEVLRIGSQKTVAESYEGKGELGNLSIRFVGKNGKEIAGKSELYQNYPNPFDQRTVIGINLANAGRGSFKITDVTGRLVKVIEKDWTKGYHEVWIDRREIQPSGVLYYSFEGQTFRAVKKMVIVE